jgi:hypothetical protein
MSLLFCWVHYWNEYSGVTEFLFFFFLGRLLWILLIFLLVVLIVASIMATYLVIPPPSVRRDLQNFNKNITHLLVFIANEVLQKDVIKNNRVLEKFTLTGIFSDIVLFSFLSLSLSLSLSL